MYIYIYVHICTYIIQIYIYQGVLLSHGVPVVTRYVDRRGYLYISVYIGKYRYTSVHVYSSVMVSQSSRDMLIGGDTYTYRYISVTIGGDAYSHTTNIIIHTNTHTLTRTHTHAQSYIYKYMCVCVCIYTHTHAHTLGRGYLELA